MATSSRYSHSGFLCHIADTYKQEQGRVPNENGNTVVVEYVMCSRCHKSLEKNTYLER